MRKAYEASFEDLRQRVPIIGEPRPNVVHCPRLEDDEPGPSIFWERVEDVRLEELTLPGLYVAQERLERVAFAGADLHVSTFNWSDFAGCSFASCDLSRADLRACTFSRCSFRDADLSGADLRRSTFASCDLGGARLAGAVLFRRPGRFWAFVRSVRPLSWATRDQTGMPLSHEQRAEVVWSPLQPRPEPVRARR